MMYILLMCVGSIRLGVLLVAAVVVNIGAALADPSASVEQPLYFSGTNARAIGYTNKMYKSTASMSLTLQGGGVPETQVAVFQGGGSGDL